MAAKAVHGTALDKVFHRPLVQLALPHPFQKILQITERAALGALRHHGTNQAVTHAFHRPQAKADAVSLHGKMVFRVVDVRRQCLDANLLALGNITGNLLRRVQHRGHQRRHILPGVVTLEIGRLVRNNGIANGVRLIERIVCKGNNLIIDGLPHRLRHAPGNAAVNLLLGVAIDKGLPLRLNDLHFLFGDGAADVIRLSHGIAAQGAENLNHLLLIHDAAIGNLQNGFQQRCLIDDLPGIQLIGDKSRNGFHGAGAVQRHDGRNVLDGAGAHTHAHAGHTCRFQLEHTLGLALGQHGKGFFVIVRDMVDGKTGILHLNLLLCITDDRQVPQTQKVHF